MATGLRPYIENIFLVVLFSFFIIMFAVSWIAHSNPTSPVLESQYGLNASASALQGSIDDFTNTANTAQSDLASAKPSATSFLFLIFEQAFYIPWNFLKLITTIVFVTLPSLLRPLFGSLSLIISITLSAVSVILIIAAIFLIIKSIRTGESER